MNTKQVLAVLLLGFPMCAAPAPRTDQEAQGHEEREDSRAARIIIRSDTEKKQRQALRQGSENSNRQSDPDSDRGLERAEERRPEQVTAHVQGRTDERGWYEYLFGKRQEPEHKSERDWYAYLFGRPAREDKAKDKDDDDSWWWPFD